MRWAKMGLIALAVAGLWAVAAQAAEEEWKPQGDGWTCLFNGKDFTGWKFVGGTNKFWKVEDGVLDNALEKGQHGCDIFTDQKFRNFQLHIEFKVPKSGNSGVYLRGRKEIQISDSYGKEKPGSGDCGGIYSKVAPSENAVKPAGEWNAYDITIVGDKITCALNGKTIHDGVEVKGCTGGALDGDDSKPGALMMQGNHTAVCYRNIWIKPLPEEEAK